MARFPSSTPWRFAITDRNSAVITLLDHYATDRTVSFGLNVPATAGGRVPSEVPIVNIGWTDDDPYLHEGSRLLYGFRREGSPTEWVIRFAGIIMQLEDTAAEDAATSPFTAYDPWQYLFSRPVVNNLGEYPGTAGLSFTATRADVVIGTLLEYTIGFHGEVGIDGGVDYGGTVSWDGTIEECAQIDINFEQGLSVGEAWQQVCALDVCDIVLTPIYDPSARFGYMVELNIYEQAGSIRNNAIFGWNRPPRSLTEISRLRDGLSRANKIQFFQDQGGDPVPLQTDTASVTKYGEYWAQQFFPGQTVDAAVTAMAELQLALRKNGKQTVTITPAPERSPDPFNGYYLGDRVPVYASNKLREALSGYQRVYGIPIEVDDNGVERVRQLLASPPS